MAILLGLLATIPGLLIGCGVGFVLSIFLKAGYFVFWCGAIGGIIGFVSPGGCIAVVLILGVWREQTGAAERERLRAEDTQPFAPSERYLCRKCGRRFPRWHAKRTRRHVVYGFYCPYCGAPSLGTRLRAIPVAVILAVILSWGLYTLMQSLLR